MNERHLKTLEALGIKIGDKISIPGWFTYLVTLEGFIISDKGYTKKPSVREFDILLDRGFKVLE